MPTKRNTSARERCKELLLLGYSYEKIANELDCEPKTIKRWLQDKKFLDELRKDSRLVHNIAIMRAISANDKAIDTLLDVMDNGTDRNRLTAARTILEASVRWLDNDLEARIEAIEEMMEKEDEN